MNNPHPAPLTRGGLYFLGFVFICFLGLRVVDWVRGPDTPPRVDVPEVTYKQIKEGAEPAVVETIHESSPEPLVSPESATDPVPEPTSSSQPAPTPESAAEPAVDLPASFNLAVPFTSQAPFGVWDALHEDACEEAAAYMVLQYFAGETDAVLDPHVTDQYLQASIADEEAQGLGLSVSLHEFARFLEGREGVGTEIVDNPTVEMLKGYIYAGRPVIVPAAGRKLHNPFFTGEGPLYHMLVLRGYTSEGFITNEPGTRQGQGYFYTFEVLMDAMADWNGGDPTNGPKRVLLLSPEGE